MSVSSRRQKYASSLGLLTLFSLTVAAAPTPERPNVLLIMSDNQSASLLGAYGHPVIQTPNIDQLAADGMLFERAYATSGVCSPSRAVLLTGRIPSANGVHNGLRGRWPAAGYSAIAEYRNWPQTLADAGYRTGLVGKYHLGTSDKPTLGFDFWVTFQGGHTESFTDARIFDNGKTYNVAEVSEHLTDFWTQRAVDFIESAPAEQPFFLWLSYNGPYILPPTVNEPPVSRFAAGYIQQPPPVPQHPVHPYIRDWAKEAGEGNDPNIVGGSYPWAAIDALNNERAMINIAAETTHVDHGVGQVLAALREQGLEDNTLVIYLSDQGSAYGQHGIWGNSSWGEPPPAYNANMQVPLIFRQPGKIPAGRRQAMMINQFDVFPTVLDYVGLGELSIDNSPGESFAPALRGEAMDWQDEVFFEYITTRVIQTPQWKFTKRFIDSPNELYDMAADPGETRNLIDDAAYAPVIEQLDARLGEFFTTYADPEFDPWNGGTGKALLFYSSQRTNRFREVFPGFRDPFIEVRPVFRD